MKNQYENCEDTIRLSIHIDTNHHRYYSSIYPHHGRWQALISTMVLKFINELQARGITHWSPDNEHAIESAVAGLSFNQTPGNNSQLNDRRGTDAIRPESPQPADIPTNPNLPPAGRGRKGTKSNL